MAAWSVSVEMFFYLVFPLFFPLLRQGRFSSGLLFTIGAVIFLLTQLVLLSIVNSPSFEGDRSFVGIVIRFNPLAHFCSFFLGIVGAIWFLRTQSKQQEKGSGLVSLIVLCAVIYFLLNNEVKIREMLPLELPAQNSLHAPLFLAFIIVIARGNNFIVNTLGRGVFKSLGDASYGFYIYQYPVICILYYVVDITDYMSPDAAFGVLAVTLLAISLLSFHYFEVPVQRRVRQALSRETPS
jgi:peptidoglycan/LPS O-acetylase OafA/YrhL